MVLVCFVSQKRLRAILAVIGFGTVFLWVVFGTYASDGASIDVAQLGSRDWRTHRRLLAVTDSSNGSKGGGDVPYDPATADCEEMHNIPNVSKCDFVSTVENCQEEDGLLNYLKFVYCTMPSHLIPLAMVVLFLWMIVLFMLLGTTAEEYFCPSLKVMSHILRLSQNVAKKVGAYGEETFILYLILTAIHGVTFLALGNGAPDIFSAYAAIDQNDDRDASLAIGALFGAGLLVTTVLMGAVAVLKPVQLSQLPFIRDIIFYLAAVYWTFCLLWDGKIDVWNASGFILLYIIYVTVVVGVHIVYQKLWKKGKTEDKSGATSSPGNEVNGKVAYTPEANGHVPSTTVTSFIMNDKHPFPNGGQIHIKEGPSLEGSTGVSNGKVTNSKFPGVHMSSSDEDETKPNDSEASYSAYEVGSQYSGSELPNSRMRRPHAYHQRFDILSQEPPKDSPKLFRRTISGVLDLTEEVGAAVAIPHVPQIWEEVHRSHSRQSYGALDEKDEKEEICSSVTEKNETTPLVRTKKSRKLHPFIKMIRGIWPLGPSFRDLGYAGKVIEIIKIPFSIILAITVPVVDLDEDDQNWNKWLNVFHVVSGPVFIALVTKKGLIMIGGVFPVAMIVLILAVFVAIFVGLTSTNDKPPRYHCLFSWLAFAVSVVWIYTIANEIVNVLDAFGLTVKLSNGILGLTLLAWGNSVGDAVANITMARQGFPKMALAACFGGPLLNTLLGIGIASLVKSIRREADGLQFPLYFTQVEFLSFVFLVGSLVSSLIAIGTFRIKLRWHYGVYLLVLYIITIVVLIVAEFDVFRIPHINTVDNV